MKPYNKKKKSKVTLKTHHRHKEQSNTDAKEAADSGLPIRSEDIHSHKSQ